MLQFRRASTWATTAFTMIRKWCSQFRHRSSTPVVQISLQIIYYCSLSHFCQQTQALLLDFLACKGMLGLYLLAKDIHSSLSNTKVMLVYVRMVQCTSLWHQCRYTDILTKKKCIFQNYFLSFYKHMASLGWLCRCFCSPLCLVIEKCHCIDAVLSCPLTLPYSLFALPDIDLCL